MYNIDVFLKPQNDLIEILKRQQEMLDFSGIRKALTEYDNFRSKLFDLNKFNINISKSFEPIYEIIENLKPSFTAIENVTNILSRYSDYFKLIENNSIIAVVEQLQKIIDLSYVEQREVINSDISKPNKEEIIELDQVEREEVNLIIQETINDINTQNTNIEKHLMLWYEKLKAKYPIRARLIVKVVGFILTFYITSLLNISPFSFNAKIRETPNRDSPVILNISIEDIKIIETENINYYFKVEYLDENNNTRIGYVSKKNISEIKKSKKQYESRKEGNNIENLKE